MRLLLDTHVWVWSLVDAARLSAWVRRSLRDAESELWLSPISVWETLVHIERGRIEVEDAPEDWIREALETAPLREAALNHEIAIRSRTLDLPTRDPADRFLAATAPVYELTLVTADEMLLRSRAVATLAAV